MKIALRPWTMDDLDNLVRYADNFEVAKNLRDMFPHPYTREDGITFIKRLSERDPANILAITLSGGAIGGIGIHPRTDIHEKNAELGYWLGQPFWGKGIMTNAVSLMVEYAFLNFNIERIYASPFGPNIGSQRVLEKAGFILEARLKDTIYKNGEYYDELFYAVRKTKNHEQT